MGRRRYLAICAAHVRAAGVRLDGDPADLAAWLEAGAASGHLQGLPISRDSAIAFVERSGYRDPDWSARSDDFVRGAMTASIYSAAMRAAVTPAAPEQPAISDRDRADARQRHYVQLASETDEQHAARIDEGAELAARQRTARAPTPSAKKPHPMHDAWQRQLRGEFEDDK